MHVVPYPCIYNYARIFVNTPPAMSHVHTHVNHCCVCNELPRRISDASQARGIMHADASSYSAEATAAVTTGELSLTNLRAVQI